MDLENLKKAKIIVEDFDKILSGVIRNDSIRHTAASLCAIYYFENSDIGKTDDAIRIVNDRLHIVKKKKISYNKEKEIRKVLDACAEEYDVTVDELLSKCRKRRLVTPRQMAMKLLRYNFKYPLSTKEIGAVFGRDHTTVIHSTRTVIGYLEVKDGYLFESHARILKKLK